MFSSGSLHHVWEIAVTNHACNLPNLSKGPMTAQQPPDEQKNVQARIMDFLADWQADQRQVRSFFSRLLDKFAELNANLDFVVRKGVSASLRAGGKPGALSHPLFCLVDVVEDSDGPWLSVCFYANTVTDPEQLGNLVPEGLLGEDGYCFDIEHPDDGVERYIHARITAAFAACSPNIA